MIWPRDVPGIKKKSILWQFTKNSPESLGIKEEKRKKNVQYIKKTNRKKKITYKMHNKKAGKNQFVVP